MKVKLQPIYFDPGRDGEFDIQIHNFNHLLAGQAEFLEPVPLGSTTHDADAVIFPQMLGEAYRNLNEFRKINLPILVITSEFGTVSMWDWEICSYLRSEGIQTIAPYSFVQTQKIIQALKVKKELNSTRFIVYQDNPGEGFQASIFKRFYWWEEECTQRIYEKFGVSLIKKSFRELGRSASEISDEEVSALKVGAYQNEGVSLQALSGALKLFLAIKRELSRDPLIKAAGINCLNESHFSDTTPCLAWNLLFEESNLLWGCEADTLSMLTKYLMYHVLKTPVMMTNLYPFLMGQAALKHEKIPQFPNIEDPENHILVAHCGYLGVVPQSFSTEWILRPKVLSIVDENATAIDARLPTGKVTLVKLNPNLEMLSVIRGELEGYVQYPGSHCLNGGIIRVASGSQLMKRLDSHHYILMTGDQADDIELIAPIFSLGIDLF